MMSASLLKPLLWSFLPAQLAQRALPTLSTHLPQIFPPAPRGSPQHVLNYRVVYSLIVFGYLAWSFLGQGDAEVGEDWYALLGVSRLVEDDGLKRAFRSLSRTYHPDRAGPEHGELFILLRQAYETLLDPTRRYAYDRFGPDIVDWKQPKTVKEFMYTGVTRSIGFYVVSGGLMLGLSILGKAARGAYWRYVLFAVLLYLELSLVLAPTPPSGRLPFVPAVVSHLVPATLLERPQFIWIRTLRRIWATLSIGIGQLADVWADRKVPEGEAMEALAALVKGLDEETAQQFRDAVLPAPSHALYPSAVHAEVQARANQMLQTRAENMLVERNLSSHPAVYERWRDAMRQNRPTVAQRGSHVRQLRVLDVARSIPLPPSPPPSP